MATPGPRNPRPKLVLISADDLDAVKLDEDEQQDGATTLMELLQPAIADVPLKALRRIFTITYGGDFTRPTEEEVADIRRVALAPLGELGKEMELLGLARVDQDSSYKHDRGPQLCTCMIVPPRELRRRVKVPGSRKREALADIFETVPADPFLIALRRILSLTFTEATTPAQFDRVIEDIRYMAAAALVPCNAFLERMWLEPVAMPTCRRFVDGLDTCDGSDDEYEGPLS